jgi:O-antigen ligase
MSFVWLALLVLLVVVPIPFGGNRPWAWSLMSLWTSVLLGCWSSLLWSGRISLVWRSAFAFPMVLVALVLGWIIITLIPGLGPVNPAWGIASEQLGVSLPARTAISADAALVSLMKLATYLTIFWLTLQYARDRDRANQLLCIVSWSGLVFALYGLINFVYGNPYLLWYARWTSQADVTATFVNRNHYATFAGLGLLCSAGVGTAAFHAAWRLSDRSQATFPRTLECLVGKPLTYFVIMLVIAMAWLQTHSRMGAAAVSLGIVAMLVLMLLSGLLRKKLVLLFIVPLLCVFLAEVSGNITLERIGGTMEIDRLTIFEVVADQIGSAPLTGSGYGSFSQSFPIYRDLRLPGTATYLEAHNTYLELAAEIGIPATILFEIAILWCVFLCLMGAFRRRRDIVYPIVAVSATIVVGVHALLDFSVQIPAVAALYSALLGVGVAQSWSTSDEK